MTKSSPSIWLYIYSKLQIDGEDFVNFCGILEKTQTLHNSFFSIWPFCKISLTFQWIIKQFPHLKIGSRKVIDRGSAPIWHPGFYLKSADNQGNCCQWIQKEISQNGHRGNLRCIQSYTYQALFIHLKVLTKAKNGLVSGRLACTKSRTKILNKIEI